MESAVKVGALCVCVCVMFDLATRYPPGQFPSDNVIDPKPPHNPRALCLYTYDWPSKVHRQSG